MNSIERIKTAIDFKTPDRVPVIAQVFGHAATVAGVALGDYVQDGDLLARCQIKALERYEYDAVFALMDVSVETEAVGSNLNYRTNEYPGIRSYALSGGEDIEGLSTPNPLQAARMPEILKAVKCLRREVGDDVLVVGCVSGPMTLATQLLGMEKALYLAIDTPETIAGESSRLLDRFNQRGGFILSSGCEIPPESKPENIAAMVSATREKV